MATKGVDVKSSGGQLTTAGLSGKTVTNVLVHKHGAVMVFEVVFSGGSAFLKHKQGVAEIGGTIEWGTGTQVTL